VRAASIAMALTGALLIVPAQANAGWTWWRAGHIGAGARDGDVTHAELTSSHALSDGASRKASAGAHLPGGWTQYGPFFTAWQQVCQPYSYENLGALVENPHTVPQEDFDGWAGWRANGVYVGC